MRRPIFRASEKMRTLEQQSFRLMERGVLAFQMIRLTDKAKDFIDYFMEHDASCFRPLLEKMTAQDLEDFGHALDQLLEVFCRLPGCCGGMDRPANDAETG